MPIELRGVRVHNLKDVNIDLPYNDLIVFCGLSGSGKSSLAIDTLYAEGQRRYIESFSSYTRQFLEKLEKPDAQSIDGVPAAIAVTTKQYGQVSRSTVGTATETIEYLRLLYAKIGTPYCVRCGREVRVDTVDSIIAELDSLRSELSAEYRVVIAFPPPVDTLDLDYTGFVNHWKKLGFIRGTMNGKPFRLDEINAIFSENDYLAYRNLVGRTKDNSDDSTTTSTFDTEQFDSAFDDFNDIVNDNVNLLKDNIKNNQSPDDNDDNFDDDSEIETKPMSDFFQQTIPQQTATPNGSEGITGNTNHKTTATVHGCCSSNDRRLLFDADNVVIGRTEAERVREALETAMSFGDGKCCVIFHDTNSTSAPRRRMFSDKLVCDDCGIEIPPLEVRLFSFNSPLGACPTCEGFGSIVNYDLDLIIPNKNRSFKDGAIAAWSTPVYRPKLDEFLTIAPSIGIPVDIPFSQLSPEQISLFLYGDKPSTDKTGNVKATNVRKKKSGSPYWGGLIEFFEKLQRQKYKMPVRVFISRWQSYHSCNDCCGTRLRAESRAVRVGGKSIADASAMKIDDLIEFLETLTLGDWQRSLVRTALEQTLSRLRYLVSVGLNYLTLDRSVRTLSNGEQRRVSLTSALGSSLVDMLYVLDEPSIGLHPCDTSRLVDAIKQLRNRGNTLVVVEHDEAILNAADHVVEIGPGAGENGGQLVFQGTVEQLIASPQSLTGSYLSGHRGIGKPSKRRPATHGLLELSGAAGHNLKNVEVVFPLGVLCVVTGVSGAGKSTLVQDTLYPALCRKLGKENVVGGLPFQQLLGAGQVDDVIMVDQKPIGRSPRSNPVTYLKIFDEIRTVFAETPEAKSRSYTAGYFSFNVDGGRCNTCKGDGVITIDMQFMADMYVSCPQCHGKRYQREILDVTYRSKTIADVLDMTAREAFGFFRGQPKVQHKLKRLIDVGLDYIRLGQSANTLSGGESQRLKLAAYLSQAKHGHTLFLLDEPSAGLHFADVLQLLDCFDSLIDTGHSLIVIEHDQQIMKAADYIIDIGPGAADKGGEIAATGTPEEVAANKNSVTGKFLESILG
ncbi:MAG: excinuclease ABC subunit UvrA [Planctomycetaceae bacterium]|jgi:excinuclease ABC subunit A|nr:excinuclease ABC subunit UvrA [Planctomycetaceae bacterium]